MPNIRTVRTVRYSKDAEICMTEEIRSFDE